MIVGTSNKFDWFWGGTSTGTGSTFYLGARGRFCCWSSLLELKVLHYGHWTIYVTYASNQIVIALDLVLVISPSSLISIVLGCITLVTVLPSGPLAIVLGNSIVIPLTLIWSLLWGDSVGG